MIVKGSVPEETRVDSSAMGLLSRIVGERLAERAPILVADAAGTLLLVNPRAAALLNCSQSRFRGTDVTGVIRFEAGPDDGADTLDEWEGPVQVKIRDQPPISIDAHLWWLRQRTGPLMVAVLKEDLRVAREQAFLEGAMHESAYIGMGLHDRLLQDLSYIRLRLDQLRLAHGIEHDPLLDSIVQELQEMAADMRQLSIALVRTNLSASLQESVAAVAQRAKRRFDGALQLTVEGEEGQLSSRAKVHVLRILEEALNNVWKHAGAENVSVTIRFDNDWLELAIEDDGRGFRSDDVDASRLGLANMKRRAEDIAGTLILESTPGKGTRVRVVAPLEPNWAAES